MANDDVNKWIDELIKGVKDNENCEDVINEDWVNPNWIPEHFAADLTRPLVESGQGENSVIAANNGGESGENNLADGSPEFAGASDLYVPPLNPTEEENQEIPDPSVEIPENGESGRKRKRTAEEVITNSAVAPPPRESLAGISGHSLIAHVLTVPQGEDVLDMIQSVMGHGNVCIRSAIGSIRNPSIVQPATGGISTFEGHFEIISLSGSFLLTGGRPSGGLSVALSDTNEAIIAGAVGGPLIASCPVQVMLFTFLIDNSTSHQSSRNEDYDQRPD